MILNNQVYFPVLYICSEVFKLARSLTTVFKLARSLTTIQP